MTGPAQGEWAHREAVVNGVRLHYVEAGRGPLVLLLHGFPEFWYSWRHQLPALAAAGFHAVAPDLRGYNLSAKPPGAHSYRVEALVGDVLGLIRATGHERAALAGHDWGGGIAWAAAMRHPAAVERLVVLNAPHPAAFARELRTASQLRRSWYVFFFQLPWLPEWLFRRRDFAALGRTLRRDPARPGAFTEEDVRLYKEALARPGALTAAINYYRALFRDGTRWVGGRVPRIEAPTLLIWGERDRYLGLRLTEGLERWVPNVRVERLPDASHWVQCDAPERVNELMVEFLTSPLAACVSRPRHLGEAP
jgi:pimeloyl-ACP methyl ester carboxylesterase